MKTLKIACVGDIMCGESFYALGQGVATSLDRYGRDFLPNEIVDVLSGHDLVLCNIESVLSDIERKENSLRSLHMRGRPQAAEYLAQWGITVANLANNHILEQGNECAIDTVRQLHTAGVKTVGAGENGCFQSGIRGVDVKLGDKLVTVIGACFHTGKYAFSSKLNEVLESIRAGASKESLVIVSVHWGDELMNRPSIWQREIAREFLSAGASLIIGHHPHVVQGIEIFNGGLVAYSLGNFIFDSFIEDTKWSIILSVTISGRHSIKWQCVPIKRDKEHRPELVTSENKDRLECEIKRRCDLLELKMSDHCYHKRYQSDFASRDVSARRKLYFELLKRSLHFKLIYWPQILWRPIQRRIGMW